MNWFLEPLKKYAVFSGRARRMEYWMFMLGVIVIAVVLVILEIGVSEGPGILTSLFYLSILLPGIAVGVRRLHDTGRSGWWWFISVIPILGGLWMLVLTLLDSEPGENQYGPNPKGIAAEAAFAMPEVSPPPSAEEIVRQRYARGEIDAETLNQMLDEIRHSFGKRRADVGVGVVGGQPGRIPARPPYACPKCGSTSVRRALIGATVQCKEAECRHIFDWSR